MLPVTGSSLISKVPGAVLACTKPVLTLRPALPPRPTFPTAPLPSAMLEVTANFSRRPDPVLRASQGLFSFILVAVLLSGDQCLPSAGEYGCSSAGTYQCYWTGAKMVRYFCATGKLLPHCHPVPPRALPQEPSPPAPAPVQQPLDWSGPCRRGN